MGIAEDYQQALLGLLPPGPAWPRDADSPHAKLLGGLAVEFYRVDDQGDLLVEEADPRTTETLLTRWESICGIVSIASTLTLRQLAVTGAITRRGGQTAAYYIALAAKLGFTATITEFNEHSFDDNLDASWNGADWAFAWQLNVPMVAGNVIDLTVDGDVDMPFSIFSSSIDTGPFVEYKPAHTNVLFSYN